ncbi:MAG TPA: tRNA (adenosine(37)-N6)-threonylcarbamoyltransferase complex ATPase subunit type 1 TsaE [Perlabentimonas sp.]|jgi:tRNA threonylcarbamoyladenosine biosynthesis protein TsaE|nr:tRNA (adenosine(37)-N6)-threonylcarbamoyltransferase complex ATPase subunit type 1 TsaE [Bacteroidales bacterium]MDD4672711.1 tRNA (adenosine(37)-N6)-threonylcarbamoyltransferase complex ATPase subunit type 1 TsaE [Bacteroidales bacterium]MDY0347567.1 tRNA (adenosine(37)-N6)-threonylcarbamoyltransferase complex ATPase subunit type 1 TsaE [Tenuifilaceae bacterium]HZJ74338.1 tRNA (adenosine(37)-N6)-threonylcarbamoyltransferase complex ATPase subunit type 1 TsaE [Perlabentimonas sp.]
MDSYHLASIDDITNAAKWVIEQVGENHIICFYGPMGAGKTTLIKAVCQQLGVTDTVVSPTFAIINEYSDGKGNPIFHFDFYRINKIEEVYDFGYEEYFYSTQGTCLIEWPELVEDILPLENVVRFRINIVNQHARTISKI